MEQDLRVRILPLHILLKKMHSGNLDNYFFVFGCYHGFMGLVNFSVRGSAIAFPLNLFKRKVIIGIEG